MSNLGIGVMLGVLGGNETTVAALKAAQGKRIRSIGIESDDLKIALETGETLVLSDEGQSCCEHRYMTTDDDGAAYVGAELMGVELREAPSISDDYGSHEVEFLDVKTSAGVFTCATHNEHNGYYGGFYVQARLVSP